MVSSDYANVYTIADKFFTGFSVDSITKARTLIKEKTEEAKKLADKASKAAYDKGLEVSSSPLLLCFECDDIA